MIFVLVWLFPASGQRMCTDTLLQCTPFQEYQRFNLKVLYNCPLCFCVALRNSTVCSRDFEWQCLHGQFCSHCCDTKRSPCVPVFLSPVFPGCSLLPCGLTWPGWSPRGPGREQADRWAHIPGRAGWRRDICFCCIPGYTLSTAGSWENKDSRLLHQACVTQLPSPSVRAVSDARKLPKPRPGRHSVGPDLVLLNESDWPEAHAAFAACVHSGSRALTSLWVYNRHIITRRPWHNCAAFNTFSEPFWICFLVQYI